MKHISLRASCVVVCVVVYYIIFALNFNVSFTYCNVLYAMLTYEQKNILCLDEMSWSCKYVIYLDLYNSLCERWRAYQDPHQLTVRNNQMNKYVLPIFHHSPFYFTRQNICLWINKKENILCSK